MNSFGFVDYDELRKQITLLHVAKSEKEIMDCKYLSTSELCELRRQFSLSGFYEALEKRIEIAFREGVGKGDYLAFCRFMEDNGFEDSLKLIPDEGLRLKFLKRIKDNHKKAEVLASLSDDEVKLNFLSGFNKEEDRVCIVSSLNSDESKLELLTTFMDYHKQARVIASLESDEKKLEFIYSGQLKSSVTADVVMSLHDDDKKEELMAFIPSDTARFRVITSVKDVELKKLLFDAEIRSSEVRRRKFPEFVLSLPISEQLQHFHEFNDGVKFLILRECDMDTQIKLVSEIENEEFKRTILAAFEADDISRYLSKRFRNTENYWVRTDSEEREANVPRDDREVTVEEIVKFSAMSDASKMALIHSYVKDKERIGRLLKNFDYKVVISEYFQIKDDAININFLDFVNAVYPVCEMNDVVVTASRDFDFDSPRSLALIDRVKGMNYPRFKLDVVRYDSYCKWEEIFSDSDVLLSANMVDLNGQRVGLEELEEISDDVKYVTIRGKQFDVKRFCLAKEVLADIFSQEFLEGLNLKDTERFEAIRTGLEVALGNLHIGFALSEANRIFENANLDEAEKVKFGSRLLYGLYNRDVFKYPGMYLGLDEDSIGVLHEWDTRKEIFSKDLPLLASEMTKKGIKKAVEIAVDDGVVSEEFGVSYVIDSLAEHRIPESGIEYGKRIVGELMHSQGLGVKDIMAMNPGAYSDVFKVGDFVVKLGLNRETKVLPQHERVLPSILRFQLKNGDGKASTFVEVQPLVKLLDQSESFFPFGEQTAVEDVFFDLRKSGIFWGDAAKRNLGYFSSMPVIPDGLFGELKQELQGNEAVEVFHTSDLADYRVSSDENPFYFVIDTDFLYEMANLAREEDVWELKMPSNLSTEYEEKFEQFERKRIEREKGRKMEFEGR